MAQKSNRGESFLSGLKRPDVVHVITVYAAVVFIIFLVVGTVKEPLRFSISPKALVIVLLCIGFVISVPII